MTEWDDPDEIDALMKEAYGYGITNPHLYPIQKLKNEVRKERNQLQLSRQQQKPCYTVQTPEYKNIVGASEAKKAIINSIIRPTQHPELYPLGWERAILLFGPPGTGKTFLAAETSRAIDAKFIEKDAASVNSKWIGEAAQNVAKIFNVARDLLQKSPKPIIIFIDEVDALFGKTQGCEDYNIEMRNQFLKEMDAAEDNGLRLPLYLIAATNKPWNIDHGFLRRFQKRIYVKLPNTAARKKLFRLYTKDLILEPSIDLTSISELSAGYSASDIRDICRDAHQLTLDRLFESEDVLMSLGVALKPKPISNEDFKICLNKRKTSVSSDLINDFEKWALKNQAN